MTATRKWSKKESAAARGYPYSHRALRKKLLAEMRDGDPCGRCGLPMDKADPSKIDLGHADDLAVVGKTHNPVRRLEHSRCNRGAGAALGNRLRGQRRANRGVSRRPAPVVEPVAEPYAEPVERALPALIPGMGHGVEYEHNLNSYGAHVPLHLRHGGWIVEVDP